MSLLSLLASAITGQAPQTPTAPQPTPTPDVKQPDTPVDELVVSPPNTGVKQTLQPNTVNYNNVNQAKAVNQAVAGEGTPSGGSVNPGIYGLLPHGLQHGTLRNVFGALGDAMLVGGGGNAVYRPRMENQAVGNAMAGMDINDPASVAAANQRIMATGVPGAEQLVEKNQELSEQAALRKQYMQYNQDYRNQALGVRQQSIGERYLPYLGNQLSSVKTADDYNKFYTNAGKIATKLGSTPEQLWGLPTPDIWQPGMTQGFGMTANQSQIASDKQAQRDTSMRNTNVMAGARMGAAGIAANARIQTAKTTEMKALQSRIENGTATPQDQQLWARYTQLNGRGGRALPPGLTPNSGGNGGAKQFINGHIYQDAHGNKAMYQNGQWIPQH